MLLTEGQVRCRYVCKREGVHSKNGLLLTFLELGKAGRAQAACTRVADEVVVGASSNGAHLTPIKGSPGECCGMECGVAVSAERH